MRTLLLAFAVLSNPAAAQDVSIIWDGSCYDSEVAGQGSLVVDKSFNGVDHDVALRGTLTVWSERNGDSRHELPPGLMPTLDTLNRSCSVQLLDGIDTSTVNSFGYEGVHVGWDGNPAFDQGYLFVPSGSAGTYELVCRWRTAEPTPVSELRACPGVQPAGGNVSSRGELSVSGTVPGRMTFTLFGFSPGSRVAVLRGADFGSDVVPSGSCAGADTGLSEPGVVELFDVDAAGDGARVVTLPADWSGASISVFDMSACLATRATLPTNLGSRGSATTARPSR